MMQKVLGTELATGVTATGLSGIHEQSGTNSSQGSHKVYKNRQGQELAVYVTEKYKEFSFEALIESSAPDYEYGDTATIGGINGMITKWDVTESNEDVKKVSGTIRTFSDLSA